MNHLHFDDEIFNNNNNNNEICSPTLGSLRFDKFNEMQFGMITVPSTASLIDMNPLNNNNNNNNNNNSIVENDVISEKSSHGVKRKMKESSEAELSEKEKKRRLRLEKNKINSRKSRQRQKEYIASLEEKVKKLEETNQHLQSQLDISRIHANNTTSINTSNNNSSNNNSNNENNDVLANRIPFDANIYASNLKILENMLQKMENCKNDDEKTAVEYDLRNTIDKMEQILDYYSQPRLDEVTYHMQRIAQLLVPLPHSKFVLWGLQQEDKFYKTSTQHGGIFNHIAQVLKANPTQVERMLSLRGNAKEVIQAFDQSINTLKTLHQNVDVHVSKAVNFFKVLRGIFTPTQVASFVLWINQNQALLSMLNSVLAVDTTAPDKVALQHSTDPSQMTQSLQLNNEKSK